MRVQRMVIATTQIRYEYSQLPVVVKPTIKLLSRSFLTERVRLVLGLALLRVTETISHMVSGCVTESTESDSRKHEYGYMKWK